MRGQYRDDADSSYSGYWILDATVILEGLFVFEINVRNLSNDPP